ncbi:MAG: response regulator transcription factor [Planctomycetaceae bacterium]|nr:response regulator transcription factor [Planctomycetaceae bacterium]
MQRILVVEDQRNLRRSIIAALSEAGFDTVGASTIGEAAEQLSTNVSAVILDIMLPDGSGLDWLQDVRRAGKDVPVILLTARDSVLDRVAGLDSGADDYIVKPFAVDELLARIRAVLRRRSSELPKEPLMLEFEDIKLDLLERTVVRNDQSIELQQRQFELLAFLVRHRNQIVTREMIAVSVWKQPDATWTNVIEVHINQLRKKLEDPGKPPILQTVRGKGYRLGDAR